MKQKYFFQEVDYFWCLVPTCVQLFETPWTSAHQASLSFTVSHSSLKLISIQSVMPSSHLILSFPLLLLPSVFLSIGVFSTELALHIRWPKYWSMQLPVNIQGWFPLVLNGLISLKSKRLSRISSSTMVQKHQFFWHSAFFMIQLSHDYWKNHSFDFVGKVMSLLFNTLSRFVIAFLPRSKCLLISWLESPSTVILEPKKIKSVTVPLFPYLFAMK